MVQKQVKVHDYDSLDEFSLRTQVRERIFGDRRPTVFGLTKRAYHTLIPKQTQPRTLVFILGCQRSGTSMLIRAFARDWKTKTHGETGLSPKRSRKLLPAEEIKAVLAREKASLNIVKPLCDSQNVRPYLDYFANSKAIWVYRNYRSVAKSNLVMFGEENAKRNIRLLADPNGAGNAWSTEHATEETAAIIRQHFSEEMSANDAAALFWYVRNRLYFDLGLHEHPRVTICKYEELVQHPQRHLEEIYRFIGYPYPGDHIIEHVHTRSARPRKAFELSPAVEALCQELLARLDEANQWR